jgi:hypothetical protein
MMTQNLSPRGPQRYALGKVRTRQGDDGWDYFPYGWLGRGYRVDDAELARFIRLEHGRWLIVVFPVLWLVAAFVIGVVFRGRVERSVALFAGAAVAGLIWMVWFAVVVARRTRRLAPAERPLPGSSCGGGRRLSSPAGACCSCSLRGRALWHWASC